MRKFVEIMLTVVMFFAVALNFQFAIAGPYEAEILGDNPVGYWRLGETTGMTAVNLGSLGVTGNGTYTGSYVLGVDGALSNDSDSSVEFDGGAVSVPHNSILSIQDTLTLEVWFRQRTMPQFPADGWRQYFIEKGVDVGKGHYFLRYEWPNSGREASYEFGFTDDPAGIIVNFPAQDVALNAWHHLVGTFDRTNLLVRLYLDGELVSESNLDPNYQPGTNTSTLNIARMPDNGFPYFFRGTVDEAAIYDSVLSPQQIRDHYLIGIGAGINLLTVSPSPLVGRQDGVFTVTRALPDELTWMLYSLDGLGQTFIRSLNVIVDLNQPKLAFGPGRTDVNGDWVWTGRMPAVIHSFPVWFQGVQRQNVTNYVGTEIVVQ